MEKYIKNKNVFQYKIIPSSQIPFSQAVADACKANLCGKYGTCYTCPPAVGFWKDLETKVKGYSKALVYSCKYSLEDSFDFEGMVYGAATTQNILREIVEELKSDNQDFMVLGCEGCNLCEKCGYPDTPCRFPDKAVPSVEACGIDVVALAKNIGINYNNGPNTVTYFNIFLLR